MRVIAGKARGTKLKSLDGLLTRPSSDRLKEALFSIISNRINDCLFLDLFAGSGAIGIEALSRGARDCVFVDSSKDANSVIAANIERTHFEANANLIHTEALKALANFADKQRCFDIIYIDPPYNSELCTACLNFLSKCSILNDNGCIICETDTNRSVEHAFFENFDTRKYGNSKLTFWRYNESNLSGKL